MNRRVGTQGEGEERAAGRRRIRGIRLLVPMTRHLHEQALIGSVWTWPDIHTRHADIDAPQWRDISPRTRKAWLGAPLKALLSVDLSCRMRLVNAGCE